MIPKDQKNKDNYTKDEVRGEFLQPPHKHLTPATVDIIKFWFYDLEYKPCIRKVKITASVWLKQ